MPRFANLHFPSMGLIRHRLTPGFFTSQPDYLVLLSLSALVGAVAGLIVSAFEGAIHFLTYHRLHYFDSWALPAGITALLVILAGALFAAVGFLATAKLAPETSGSGIPHVEGALDGLHDIRWWRVLPVKFFAGALTLSSGMVLGREGPSVQIGGAVGRMCASLASKYPYAPHVLTASGAAAGLAAAFNAPLAGILFIIEEMRPQFRYNFTSFKCVTLASLTATIVLRYFHGQDAVMDIPTFKVPPLESLWLFLLLGVIFGVVGISFNRWVLKWTAFFKGYHRNNLRRVAGTGAMLGGLFALFQLYLPDISGGGVALITDFVREPMAWGLMVLVFLVRIVATLGCFSSGAPGGVFAPMLALGTLLGLAYGTVAAGLFPSLVAEPGVYAVAGMGALFAATVRAPVTGIILVVEMTDNYQLIMPLLMTTLGATFIAQAFGGSPLYSALLQQSLSTNAPAKEPEKPQTADIAAPATAAELNAPAKSE
ncbi:H(+)/Cl(-) exchange transporter ClcA [Shewanella avicenniae]|uniref:H(+)/Cl(-) exchange transporter ClcA n=1 Tax=Shewanella avicenniae TaxID=2814294 RepID=A0ABX7QT72_9GAMM|nr:H(+)/Cl(-) exchange transporter ClcA [Shewanella avicenniae]QSX34677.1 H(+)/Cl(-) exchange transporter ClcA [Shewanella avicenniae]